MRITNPLLNPRNHIGENTLKDAAQGNLEPLVNFLKILKILMKRFGKKHMMMPHELLEVYLAKLWVLISQMKWC